MEAVKAVQEEDPKAGKPRPTSATQFPYYNLEEAVNVATTIHHKAGGLCDRVQLAALLGHKGVKSGAFLSKVAAAKMFGVIEQRDDWQVTVTQRGIAIIAPISDDARDKALVDAFLAVELFGKVFHQFHGSTLPQNVGLKNLLETTYGVVESRSEKTVTIMLDSAEYAGLFRASGDRTRMVRPLSGSSGTATPPKPSVDEGPPPERAGGGNGRGGGGEPPDQAIDPMILAFVRKLPPAGSAITKKKRQALIDAFTATVGFIYTEEEGE